MTMKMLVVLSVFVLFAVLAVPVLAPVQDSLRKDAFDYHVWFPTVKENQDELSIGARCGDLPRNTGNCGFGPGTTRSINRREEYAV